MKVLAASALYLLACAAFAQQSTGGDRRQDAAVIRTETRVVLVDTIVTDKDGAWVRNLAAKDFHLFEDNRPQTIQSVSVEKGAVTSRPHTIVVFFAPMGPAERALARQAVSGFIDANAGADAGENRRIAVVSYDGGLKIDQNFTDDAGRLKTGVGLAASTAGSTSSDNAAAFETVRALGGLARSLGVIEGRKTIVLVNAGIAQSSAQRAEMTSVIEACNKSDVAVYPVDVRPLQVNLAQDKFNQDSGDTDDRSALERMGRRGPGAQKVDLEAGGNDAGATNQQALYRLASGTGGFVIPNAGELQRGLQKVGEEQSEYYVLSFTPAEETKAEAKAGACHTLRVKVDRGGSTVRARSGYCDSRPQDLLAGTIAGQDLERKAATGGSDPGSSLGASMQLPYFYTSPGVVRVNLAMEIPAEAVAETRRAQLQKGKQSKARPELDFLGIATNADGDVGARFSDAVKLDADNEGKPLHYEKEFKLAPGQYTFTMAFSSGKESSSEDSFGKLEAPLTIEPWQADELGLSAIVLSRQTRPAAEVGLDIAALTETRTPLVSNDVEIVPSGSSRFRKSEPGFVYFEIYGRDPAAVQVEMRVTPRGQSAGAKPPAGIMQLKGTKAATRLPTDTLDAGPYTLEVTASDKDGKRVTRTADFEIY